MELKELLKDGAKQLRDTALDAARKLQDKGYIEKLDKTVSRTKEFLNEKHLVPGAKDAYIQELEQTVERQKKQIKKLEYQLRKKSWAGKRKGK